LDTELNSFAKFLCCVFIFFYLLYNIISHYLY
jgi:hypothetical protein